MKKIIIIALLFFVSAAYADDLVKVSLESKLIYIKGCNYIERNSSSLIPARFSNTILKIKPNILNFNPDIARWTTGIQIFFTTESKNIDVNIEISPFKNERKGIFRVYKDDIFYKDFNVKNLINKNNNYVLELKSIDGKQHRYRVDFPTNDRVKITEFKIEKGTRLHKMNFAKKPVYVALGNSITHGTVAIDGITELSYPFLLAKKLDYDLYNLGIGASRVSPPIGDMLKDWEQIDLMTLLIGYNDLSWAGVSLETYKSNYIKLIKSIRKNYPTTHFYCITLTYTTLEKSPKTGITPDEYRKAVSDIVTSFQKNGDKNIYLLHGENLTDADDLHDAVHFSKEGNKNFADKLYQEISKNLEDQDIGNNCVPEPTLKNIKYGKYERNKLDIYLADSDKPTPVLIYIHGGAFTSGDKSKIQNKLFLYALQKRISVVSINYRLSMDEDYSFSFSDKTPFPPPFEDATRAVQYIRHNAGKYNIDKNKLAVAGGSAGGGLALWLGLYDDLAIPDSNDSICRESTKPVSVVALYAQTTYDQEYITENMIYDGYKISWINKLFNSTTSELKSPKSKKMRAIVSPLNQVDKNDSIYIFMGGSNEVKVTDNMPQAQFVHNVIFYYELEKKLKAYKIPYVLALNSEYRSGKREGSVSKDAVSFLEKSFKKL